MNITDSTLREIIKLAQQLEVPPPTKPRTPPETHKPLLNIDIGPGLSVPERELNVLIESLSDDDKLELLALYYTGLVGGTMEYHLGTIKGSVPNDWTADLFSKRSKLATNLLKGVDQYTAGLFRLDAESE